MDIKSPSENWELVRARWSGESPMPGTDFDKTATGGIIALEVGILLCFAAALTLLPRIVKRVPLRFCVLAVAVLVFEIFTAPMWRNLHMGKWAYLYQQVSWILTIGWCTLIAGTISLVDHLVASSGALRRFSLSLLILTPIVFLFEIVLHGLGLREYGPEVLASSCGVQIAGVPIEAIYYVPVFLTLIISFYKYWMLILDGIPVPPRHNVPWLRTLVVSLAGVLLFEIMIEPMVDNIGLPAWSYFYKDISLVMSGGWVVILWLAVTLVEWRLPHWDLAHRFGISLIVIAAIATPLEAWLIETGVRQYGSSANANFSGLTIPWTPVPIEIVFAIPLYFALILSFVRFMQIVEFERAGGAGVNP